MRYRLTMIASLLVASLLGCSGASDTAESTDAGTPDSGVPSELCDGTLVGSIENSSWSGEGITLGFQDGHGTWSDDCYGGVIEDDLRVDGAAFDWDARIYASAGGPDPREVRAVGCVIDEAMDLSITETDRAPVWGPWRLVRSAEELEVVLCD